MPDSHAAAMAPCGARIVRWDGQKLTVDGEPFFAIYAWTRVGIASAILRLIDADTSDAEALAFAEHVIGRFDVARGFVMDRAVAEQWLHMFRASEQRRPRAVRPEAGAECTSPPGPA